MTTNHDLAALRQPPRKQLFDQLALVAAEIDSLLHRRNHRQDRRERRSARRLSIPFMFRLSPLEGPLDCESDVITVIGKDISSRGIGFYHQRPITFRRGLLSLADTSLGEFTLECDLTWCRFSDVGWYESGGRILHAQRQAIPKARAG